jgi:hypothetical protein
VVCSALTDFAATEKSDPGCPVLIDVLGNGFSITDAVGGVDLTLCPMELKKEFHGHLLVQTTLGLH